MEISSWRFEESCNSIQLGEILVWEIGCGFWNGVGFNQLKSPNPYERGEVRRRRGVGRFCPSETGARVWWAWLSLVHANIRDSFCLCRGCDNMLFLYTVPITHPHQWSRHGLYLYSGVSEFHVYNFSPAEFCPSSHPCYSAMRWEFSLIANICLSLSLLVICFQTRTI